MPRQYTFRGAVIVFGRVVAFDWTATTRAISQSKAITNIKYKFRKESGKSMNTPIDLDGRWEVAA